MEMDLFAFAFPGRPIATGRTTEQTQFAREAQPSGSGLVVPPRLIRLERRSQGRATAIANLLRRDNDIDHGIRPQLVAIRSVLLGVPVPDAAPQLIEKIETAILGQMSKIADEVGDGMFVSGAATLLENGDRFRRPGDMVSFVDELRHESLPAVPRYRSVRAKPLGDKSYPKTESRVR
jgi:hypothetical protein